MSRRKFQSLLASLGVATVTLPMWSGPARAAADDHPSVLTWEGWDSAEHHQEYQNKHGELPNFSIFGDEEEAFAKVLAGARYDVGHPCSYKVELWRDAGILQPIDVNRLDHWGDIVPSLKEIPGMTTSDGDVLTSSRRNGVTLRCSIVPISWIPSIRKRRPGESCGMSATPGRMSMADSLIDGVMVAAIYGGAKDPFNMSDAEVEVTGDLLRKQLPLLRYYWTSPTDIENAMASGELVATSSWNDSFTALKGEGINVKYMNPKEGAMTWVCGFSLMSAADPAKLDKSYDVIDAFLSPESGSGNDNG